MIKKSLNLSDLKKQKKAELHAHLFGSITQDQLLNLLLKKNLKSDHKEFSELIKNIDKIELEEIFMKVFSYLPKITKTEEELKNLIDLVFTNFIKDNVIYLEIRSSPKKIDNHGFKKYFEIIISKIKQYEKKIKIRYLVSINRSYSPEIYKNLIKTINETKDNKKYIIGIDFSGDPTKNNFSDYLKIFQEARKSGLKVTIHSPEISSSNLELKNMLNFQPDRIGHFLYFEDEDLEKIILKKIPVEICPSSNFLVAKDKEHHNFEELVAKGLEDFCICTDDVLLFDSCLSEEWKVFGDVLGLSLEQCEGYVRKSFEFAFDKECFRDLLD